MSTDSAQTYGWDTVFAIHIADANAAIAKSDSSPASFSASDAADGVSISGKFGPWRLTTGGSGELVYMAIPVTSAAIVSGGQTTNLACTATVEVRLEYIHGDCANGCSGPHDLKVKTTASDGDKVASVTAVDFGAQVPSVLVQAAVQELVESWLNDNLSAFAHVFATVDLAAIADQGEFQWMKPTSVGYAYSDLGTANDGVLAVLAMTEGRDASKLVQQVSSQVIPQSPAQKAGFLVSAPRLLSNLLLPRMTQVFPGASASDFQISATGDAIVNSRPNVPFQITTKDGKTRQAWLTALTLMVDGDELQLDVYTQVNLSDDQSTVPPDPDQDIIAICHCATYLKITLVTNTSGQQTLGYAVARPGVNVKTVTTPEGTEIADDILGIAAAVLLIISVIVTDGADIGAVALCIGLVAGVSELTTAIIQATGKNDAPAIDDMVLNATAPVTWAGTRAFKLGSAGLNGSLQLGGDPCFST